MPVELVKEGMSYIALTNSYSDGSIVKAAGGFRYQGVINGRGRWMTNDVSSAKLLLDFAVPVLREELAEAVPAPRQLLHLVQEGAEYHAIGGYDANPVIKAAGFRWNGSVWATKSLACAAKLARFASDELKAKLERAAKKEQKAAATAIEASHSTDADVEIPAPAGLNYLGYQKAGINFALRQFKVPGIDGILIGDDMGLGKTIQAIGIVNARKDIRRVLIICPASLKLNWAREWSRWCVRDMSVALAAPGDFPSTDVVIVNYDVVHKLRQEIDAVAWHFVIVDEAHVLKNRKAQRSAAVLGGNLLPTKEQKEEAKARRAKAQGDAIAPIKTKLRVFLTGTPLLNRPVEMWPLIQACDPTDLGSHFMNYAKQYCAAFKHEFGWDMTGASNLGELQTRLRSRFMVRRLKADVLKELPAKRRQLIELSANGATAVVAAERKAAAELKEAVYRAEADAMLAEALGDLTAYKKAVAAIRGAQEIAFTEMSKLRHATAVKKIPYCIEHIREAIEANGKVIVFAHHADVLAAMKKEFGDAAVVITGQTDIKSRQAAVDAFQTDPNITVFLGNILAAGVGITLTAASHVIFCELDWRPGIVTQAEDRSHRLGQVSSVLVQHLVFEDSIDAEMAKRIMDKQEIIDRALDVDAADLADLTDDSVIDNVLAGMANPQVSMEDRAAQVQEAVTAATSRQMYETKPRWQIAEEQREARWAALDDEAALMTPDQIGAVHEALRTMAGMDLDRAQDANGIGFNKGDSYAGHALAQKLVLTPRQAAAARKMLKKYHRQIGAELIEQMG